MTFKCGDRIQSIRKYDGHNIQQGNIVSIHVRNERTYYNIRWDFCGKWNGAGHNWTATEIAHVVDPNLILKGLL